MPSQETITPESAVRQYLTYLEDPTALVDEATVKGLEEAVAKAKDPIDRLKAMAALEKGKATDEKAFRFDFIKYAKQWAEENGVPVSAFRSMGVPADVLAAAGLDGQAKDRRRSKAGTAPRSRRPAVKAEALEEAILAMSEPFTAREIADRIGGSPVTIKAVLDRLAAQDRVAVVGERGAGRGRAARLWQVA